MFYGGLTRESLEAHWREEVLGFLAERLLPTAGVSLGLVGEKECFAITGVGRYLLGLEKDFDLPVEEDAEVIVQPNFEVVFLAQAPALEAFVGRFAERIGRGVGILFRITKASVFEAACAGMTADEALATLTEASSKDLPRNVVREIKGWFGQCCHVTVHSTTLIRCPDPDTATRVVVAGGKYVVPITDTLLEYRSLVPWHGSKFHRKLQDMGVFATPGYGGVTDLDDDDE